MCGCFQLLRGTVQRDLRRMRTLRERRSSRAERLPEHPLVDRCDVLRYRCPGEAGAHGSLSALGALAAYLRLGQRLNYGGDEPVFVVPVEQAYPTDTVLAGETVATTVG